MYSLFLLLFNKGPQREIFWGILLAFIYKFKWAEPQAAQRRLRLDHIYSVCLLPFSKCPAGEKFCLFYKFKWTQIRLDYIYFVCQCCVFFSKCPAGEIFLGSWKSYMRCTLHALQPKFCKACTLQALNPRNRGGVLFYPVKKEGRLITNLRSGGSCYFLMSNGRENIFLFTLVV